MASSETLRKYRVWCNDDSRYEFTDWLEESQGAPTTCPVDPVGHTIDLVKTVSIGRRQNVDVSQHPVIGGHKVVADGVSASLSGATSWHDLVVTIAPTNGLHLQGVKVQWTGGKVGDRAWLGLINPAGETSPTAVILDGATVFSVGVGKGAAYDPSGGTAHVEFWDNAGDLVEMVSVASVNGDEITLADPVTVQHETDAVLKASLGVHTQMRGAGLVGGGFHMIGAGREEFGTDLSMTAPIPQGMELAARIFLAAGGTTREISVNYKLREPSA